MGAAIEVEGLSKRFRIHHDRARSWKDRVVGFGKRSRVSEFWALRDVTFDVAEGETVGLLGHNGSGKSTLLKCIAGILRPTDGEIRRRGRVASLLELGAGFHPELTGRENVYLNAAILGISRRDVDRQFDGIVEFAEIAEFIDQQVKHYSSGMYVRLGFAVAVNVDPDILLVDEVLAVGDEDFQRKCLDKVALFQREGRTIVFVSHAPDLVRQVCDKVLVLSGGEPVTFAAPGEAIRAYRQGLYERHQERRPDTEHLQETDAATADVVLSHGERQERAATRVVEITDVVVVHGEDGTLDRVQPGEPVTIDVHFVANERVGDVVFGLAVYDQRDGKELFGANTDTLGVDVPVLDGPGVVRFRLRGVPLLDGTYPVTIGIHSHDQGTVYDWHEQRHWFQVMNPTRTVGTVAFPLDVEIEP